MGISVSGIGSGLDINSLVTQLMSAERQPMSLLKKQESAASAKISAWGQLSSSLSGFQAAARKLTGTGIAACTATSSSAAVAVTVGSGATPGNYSVQVTQLAQAQKLVSPGCADASASLGAGTLAITPAGGATVTLSPAGNSLNELRDAINNAGIGVTASIVDDGSASGKRLMIVGKDSGAAKAFSVTGTGALASFSFDPNAPVAFGYDGSGNAPAVMSRTQPAQDAAVTIDGMKVTASTNVISEAIPGVSLRVSQLTGSAVTVDVQRDAAGIKASVNDMVKAWNSLKALAGTQTAWNESTRTGAVLHGDSGPSSILSQLRGAFTKAVAGAGSLTQMNDIGLSFQKDGTLAVNDAKLQSAIDSRPADLQALFASADGIATRLNAVAGNLLGEGGVVTTRTGGLNATLRSLTQRENNEQSRLERREASYRAQFTRLDSALSSMQNTSNYLTQQLAKLSTF